jgi:hypothetical protein
MTDLTTLRRILLDLNAPADFLRQYPSLAARVREALQAAETSTRQSA